MKIQVSECETSSILPSVSFVRNEQRRIKIEGLKFYFISCIQFMRYSIEDNREEN